MRIQIIKNIFVMPCLPQAPYPNHYSIEFSFDCFKNFRSLVILGEHLFGSEDSVIAKLKDGSEVAKAVLEILEQSNKENIVEAAKSAKSADIDIDVSKQISTYLLLFIF